MKTVSSRAQQSSLRRVRGASVPRPALLHRPRSLIQVGLKYAARSNVPVRAPSRTAAATAVEEPQVSTRPSVVAPKKKALVDPTPILVLGAQGVAGIAAVRALLEAGFNVTAGLDFPSEAKATLAFVKKYELIDGASLKNLKLLDFESGSSSARGSKVLVFDVDTVGDRKTDEKVLSAAIKTATEIEASQLILISTQSASGGGFLGLGGPSPTSVNKSLSRSEQLVANSGLPVSVLRVNISSTSSASGPCKVAAGPGTLAPQGAPLSSDQFADTLAALLGAPKLVPGFPVVLEAAAQPGATESIEDAVAKAVAEVASKAPAPKPKAVLEAPRPKPTLSLGTMSLRPKVAAKTNDDDDDEEEEEEKPSGGNFLQGFLGGQAKAASPKPSPVPSKGTVKFGTSTTRGTSPAPGTQKMTPVKRKQQQEEEEDDDEAPAKSNGFFSFFGGGGKAIAAEMPPPTKAEAPKKSAGNPFSTVKRAPPPPAPSSSSKASKEEDSKESKGGFLSFFSSPPKQAPPPPSPAKAARAPVRAVSKSPPPPARAPARAKQQASSDDEDDSEPKAGGFLAFLFPPKVARDEDDTPPVKSKRPVPPPAKAPLPVKARPAPPSRPVPAPKPAARPVSAPQPAKASSNPFSSLKRYTPPEPTSQSKAATSRPGTQKTTPASGTQRVQPKQASSGTQQSGRSAKPAPKPAPKSAPPGTYKPISGFSVAPKGKK